MTSKLHGMIQNYDCCFGLRRMSGHLLSTAMAENQRIYEKLFNGLMKQGYVMGQGLKLGRDWMLNMLDRLVEESQEMAWEIDTQNKSREVK